MVRSCWFQGTNNLSSLAIGFIFFTITYQFNSDIQELQNSNKKGQRVLSAMVQSIDGYMQARVSLRSFNRDNLNAPFRMVKMQPGMIASHTNFENEYLFNTSI